MRLEQPLLPAARLPVTPGSRRLRVAAAALTALFATVPAIANGQRSRRPADDIRSTLTRDRDGAWRLDLAPGVEDALDRFDRDFEPWTGDDYRGQATDYVPSPRQVPWAVIGDFNGDGRTDVALAGRDDRDASVLIVVSTGRSRYRVIEADREPFDPDDPGSIRRPVLRYLYPGRYVIADPRLVYPRELVIEQPAVELTGARRQGAMLLTIEDDALARYYLSDTPAPPVRRGRPGAPAPVQRVGPPATSRPAGRATRAAPVTADSAIRSR